MKYRIDRQISRRGLVAAGLFAACLAFAPSAAGAADFVAVIHPDNPTSGLSTSDLRSMYRADKKSWPDGKGIALILPAQGSPAMQFLLSEVLGMSSESDLAQFYMAAIFQQKLTGMPELLAESAALQKVSATPGALAVVSAAAAQGASAVKAAPIGQ